MTKSSYEAIPTAPPEEEIPVVVVVDDAYLSSPVSAAAPSPVLREQNVPPPTISSLGRSPVHMMTCPMCRATHIRTKTKTYPGLITWILVAIGALLCLPLCWIPLVVEPMKQTDHYCQRCGEKIGEVRPFEDCCVKEQV